LRIRRQEQIVIHKCAQCRTEFQKVETVRKDRDTLNHFCSKSCRSRFFNPEKRDKQLSCSLCGKYFYRQRPRPDKCKTELTFCSRNCQGTFFHALPNDYIKERNKQTRSWGYRKDLGHICRSTWEANYCRILKHLGVKYEYEPFTFQLPNTTYKPDFKIHDVFVEVKGYVGIKNITKISLFRKFYPNIKLVVIDNSHYFSLQKHYRDIVSGWERQNNLCPRKDKDGRTPEQRRKINSIKYRLSEKGQKTQKKYYEKNSDRISKRKKEYEIRNRVRIRERRAKYHQEKGKFLSRIWREKNKDKINTKSRQDRKQNPEKYRKYSQRRYEKLKSNLEQMERKRAYDRIQRKKNKEKENRKNKVQDLGCI